MLRLLTADEVEFSIDIRPEDIPIEGNACGHEGAEECHDWIRDELHRGNEWAWCQVSVMARWNDYEASDFLGGCSYESEAAFKHPQGYWPQMQAQALEDLNAQLSRHFETLAPLRCER